MADKQIKLTLVRSLIGRSPSQRATVKGLGLKKIGQSVVLADLPSTRGIIQKIGFMLKVEEI
ncbi:MAG: 50S ribosomal protein L30 [Eubacteriaceae bacterium]|jgi:large subunit ribosomal protein L30|nr:50S ribosomal protein L30 [Eubacteriaceae bacterium]